MPKRKTGKKAPGPKKAAKRAGGLKKVSKPRRTPGGEGVRIIPPTGIVLHHPDTGAAIPATIEIRPVTKPRVNIPGR